ncbi:uncharacterized protein LOC128961638 [Oppia nitens]|uniref:uncharacterized protein LOC128961638 n=1 Tax=Oppia nitens TaxID=1686743 RepID=UPI0023DAC824|nr:uncharacterized protein LOC128961638 [Oppia nitens]
MDCGFPALPESTKINVYKKRYEEYSFIQYECDSEDKVLIGNSTIRCFNGKWLGSLPKCAIETHSRLKYLKIPDKNGNPVIRFFSSSTEDCYQPSFKWNLTATQRISIQLESDVSIDYFSIILKSKSLINGLLLGDISIKSRLAKPRKKCYNENVEPIDDNLHKIKVSFKCFETLDENLSLDSLDSIKLISFDIQSKSEILVTFCSLKTYSLSESCGSPEKPLHSIELIREKSFTIFGCEEDFYLDSISSQKVICSQSGRWNVQFPRCLAKTFCPLPAMDGTDHYINVEYINLNYLNGTPHAETKSMAIYSCLLTNNSSIVLKGDNKRVCVKGFWSGSQPKCLPKNTVNWHRLHIVIISMLVSFLIGAFFIGLVVYWVMKNVMRRHRQSTHNMPSVIISESNKYYDTNIYEEYEYESIRLNSLDLFELQRINSLYQSNSEP